MIQILLTIFSYGALLLFLMYPTIESVISTAIIFALVLVLIICKKGQKVAFEKRRHELYFLIPASILIAVRLGVNFYNRWIASSKLKTIADVFHMPVEIMLLIGSLTLSVMALYAVYAGLQIITKEITGTHHQSIFVRDLKYSLIFAIMTVILSQMMVDAEILLMGYLNFMCGVLTVSAVIVILYCLIGRIVPSILVGSGIFMLISTISGYVLKFRGRLFEPVDILSAGTAMNVAESYNLLPIPRNILIGWGVFAALLLVLYRFQHKAKAEFTAKKGCVLLTVCVISLISVFLYACDLKTYHWYNEGAQFNGCILDFIAKFKEMTASEPDHYNTEMIAELADRYSENRNEQGSGPSEYPHIIVIMDEAFSDMSVVGEYSTNTEVMPFISSLKENAISGYLLTSVYGGNTANSEYEFLTGNSMAWMSPNVVPYQQYLRSPTYSMISYLKSSYQYKCMAMHPYHPDGWNRPAAYEHLGFDECYFIREFPQMHYIREYISDQEMFEFLIETYEMNKENPLFLFGVTMQNHGGYVYTGENYTQSVSLEGYGSKFPEVEQYLSLIRETDKAVEKLITYFQTVDEEVVIAFFGDHQPKMNESFYETIGGARGNDLDERQKRYMVPFFVWANYDIEEEYIDCTSLNYLSSYVYSAAGIDLPPYNQFLRGMEAKIPSINANGYYSIENGCYLTFDQAGEEEAEWLKLYEMLQYNSTFDKANRNETLFPVLE